MTISGVDKGCVGFLKVSLSVVATRLECCCCNYVYMDS
jgi:hypothetical protein